MAISCADVIADLSAYLDGELEQERQSTLASHLTSCALCRCQYDDCKSLSAAISQFSVQISQAAPDLWESLATRLPAVCDLIQEDLSAYLDGELIAPAKEGVSIHLEQCSDCLGKFQDLSRVNGLLAKGFELPADFQVDIWSQVKSRLNEDCVLIRGELSAYVDKEVATLRHRAITGHLLECPDCKDEFVALSQSGDAIRSHYQPDLPDDFDLWPGIMARMQVVPFEAREKRKAALSVRRLYAVAATVIAGVLAAIAIFITVHSASPQVTPVTAEAYLIDSSLGEPADVAEAVVYDH